MWPRLQSLRTQGRFARVTRTVTLVAGTDADPYALDVIEDALRGAGAEEIQRSDTAGSGLTVYAGDAARPQPARLKAPEEGNLPSSGYRLAVDGDLSTSVGAGMDSGPGPLTVDFGGARLLDSVTVAASGARTGSATVGVSGEPPPGPLAGSPYGPRPMAVVETGRATPKATPAPATVEVHTPGGGWQRIGSVTGDWTELPAGVVTDAVRLSDGTGVHEVVPWFAGAPRVTLDRSELNVEIGGSAVKVTAAVVSGLPRDEQAAVAVAALKDPKGGVGATAPKTVPLRRGASAAVPLSVSVPAGTEPGTYTLPVRFTVAGHAEERRITVRAQVRTAGPDLVRGGRATSSGDETPPEPRPNPPWRRTVPETHESPGLRLICRRSGPGRHPRRTVAGMATSAGPYVRSR